MKKYFSRLGDGHPIEMTENEIMADLVAGSEDAAARGEVSPLSEDEYKLYRQLFQIIYNSLPKPDLYIYLHVEPENLLHNIEMRGRDYESTISAEYLGKIQDSYFTYFRHIYSIYFVEINQGNV